MLLKLPKNLKGESSLISKLSEKNHHLSSSQRLCSSYPFLVVRVKQVYDVVDYIHKKANTVDSGDQNAMWMNKRHRVKHPHSAVD